MRHLTKLYERLSIHETRALHLDAALQGPLNGGTVQLDTRRDKRPVLFGHSGFVGHLEVRAALHQRDRAATAAELRCLRMLADDVCRCAAQFLFEAFQCSGTTPEPQAVIFELVLL